MKLLNFFNAAFGFFPFIMKQSDLFVTLKLIWLGVFLTLIRTVLCVNAAIDCCGIYKLLRNSNPQMYSCYVNFSINTFLGLHRMLRCVKTKNFFVFVFSHVSLPNSYTNAVTKMLRTSVALIGLKVYFLTPFEFPSLFYLRISIESSLLCLGPNLVEAQITMVCIFYNKSFHR